MTQAEPLGGLVDSLGVRHRPEEGELVLGAVVLLKVMEPDGEITMRSAWSPGLSWMERVGMQHAAAQADQPAREERRDAVLPPARLDLVADLVEDLVDDLVDEDEPA